MIKGDGINIHETMVKEFLEKKGYFVQTNYRVKYGKNAWKEADIIAVKKGKATIVGEVKGTYHRYTGKKKWCDNSINRFIFLNKGAMSKLKEEFGILIRWQKVRHMPQD